MLNEEEKKIVEYLRMSPKDSLKRDAANLIERIDGECQSSRDYIQWHKDRNKALRLMNASMSADIDVLKNKKSSIWEAIKEKFK